MPKIPEDIILIIFRYLHRNKMKLLNQEYYSSFEFKKPAQILEYKIHPLHRLNYRPFSSYHRPPSGGMMRPINNFKKNIMRSGQIIFFFQGIVLPNNY